MPKLSIPEKVMKTCPPIVQPARVFLALHHTDVFYTGSWVGPLRKYLGDVRKYIQHDTHGVIVEISRDSKGNFTIKQVGEF